MVLNHLIETHSHILPGIDDGAPDAETSRRMIAKLSAQGAQAIILTPHYYSDSISLTDFVAKRQQAFQVLQSALPTGVPRLIPAAEVYISKYLFNNEDLTPICIAGTNFAMIEHSFHCDFGQNTFNRLVSLVCDYHIQPVLVHIERYKALMENPKLLAQYRELGCKTQVNISSFSDASRSVRKKLFKYLDNGYIDFIGSDCHNLDKRPPTYSDGIQAILKKCGQSTVKQLLENAQILVK